MKNRIFNLLLIVGLLATFFLTPAVKVEAIYDGFLREETITGNNPSATENDPSNPGTDPSNPGTDPSNPGTATGNDPGTATGNDPHPITLHLSNITTSEIPNDDNTVRISDIYVTLEGINLPDGAGIAAEKSSVKLTISPITKQGTKHIFTVTPGKFVLVFSDDTYKEFNVGEYSFKEVTMSVKVDLTGNVKVDHLKNGQLVESLNTSVQDGMVTFKNTKGFSTFEIDTAPAAVESKPSTSTSKPVSTAKTTQFDPNDKNHDGVVSCDELLGVSAYWDESKKSCIVNGAVPGKNYVPNTGTK